jgi:hypothetical protein
MFTLSTTISGSKKRFSVMLNKNIIVASFDTLEDAANELIARSK